MILKIQNNISNINFQHKAKHSQLHASIANKAISFGNKSEVITEDTKKLLDVLAKKIENKASQFKNDLENFRKNQETELGINILFHNEPKFQPFLKGQKNIDGSNHDIQFLLTGHKNFGCFDGDHANYDYAIYSRKEGGIGVHQIYVKNNQLLTYQDVNIPFSLNTYVQKLLTPFLDHLNK